MSETESTESAESTESTSTESTGGTGIETAPDLSGEVEKWKALSKKNEDRAKANADAAKRLAELEAASATDLEKAAKAARDEGRTEVLTVANARLVNAEARAAAAELRFKNPALAIKSVDLSSIEVNDDGEVDAGAVRAALAELANAEPYLVGDGRPKGDADQGARTTAKPEPSPGIGRLQAAYASTDTK